MGGASIAPSATSQCGSISSSPSAQAQEGEPSPAPSGLCVDSGYFRFPFLDSQELSQVYTHCLCSQDSGFQIEV